MCVCINELDRFINYLGIRQIKKMHESESVFMLTTRSEILSVSSYMLVCDEEKKRN